MGRAHRPRRTKATETELAAESLLCVSDDDLGVVSFLLAADTVWVYLAEIPTSKGCICTPDGCRGYNRVTRLATGRLLPAVINGATLRVRFSSAILSCRNSQLGDQIITDSPAWSLTGIWEQIAYYGESNQMREWIAQTIVQLPDARWHHHCEQLSRASLL